MPESHLKIGEKQIEFLEYLIWKSKNASEVTRKLLIWLLRQTSQLTTQVFVNCPPEVCKEISYGLHDMCSCNGTTHLDALFRAVGASMSPVLYNGTYTYEGKMITSDGFAIFIHDRHNKAAKQLDCDMDAVNDIVKPNPYGF